MSNNQLQAIRLESWKKYPGAKGPKKPSDPHYAGMEKLNMKLIEYLNYCITAEKPPEVFMSAWLDQKTWNLQLRIAIPEEEETREKPSTLDAFFK